MLLKDSVPDEIPTIPSEATSSFPMKHARKSNPPLPALAKEVLWFGHEKKFNELYNLPYSQFIMRLQRISESINDNDFDMTPPVSKSTFVLLNENERDMQDVKHKMIALLVSNQINMFENEHGNSDHSRWLNESYDDAVIKYYDAWQDQKELDDLRFRAWKGGARWRHADFQYGMWT